MLRFASLLNWSALFIKSFERIQTFDSCNYLNSVWVLTGSAQDVNCICWYANYTSVVQNIYFEKK